MQVHTTDTAAAWKRISEPCQFVAGGQEPSFKETQVEIALRPSVCRPCQCQPFAPTSMITWKAVQRLSSQLSDLMSGSHCCCCREQVVRVLVTLSSPGCYQHAADLSSAHACGAWQASKQHAQLLECGGCRRSRRMMAPSRSPSPRATASGGASRTPPQKAMPTLTAVKLW